MNTELRMTQATPDFCAAVYLHIPELRNSLFHVRLFYCSSPCINEGYRLCQVLGGEPVFFLKIREK